MPLVIQYRFDLKDGTREFFDIRLDPATLRRTDPVPETLPSWTNLGFHQCGHCPFTPEIRRHCPVAVNLTDLVTRLDTLASYDRLSVSVATEGRLIRKKTSAQRAISSLMGLLIAVSDCPITDFFKPMARFHLPFATEEETVWRAVGTYLHLQYFLHREGRPLDLDLRGLKEIYFNIQQMNISLARRLRSAAEKDGTVNAVVILDVFARTIPPAIETFLEKIRPLYNSLMEAR